MNGTALLVGVQQFDFTDRNLEAIPAVITDHKLLTTAWTKLGLRVETLKNSGEEKVTKERLFKKLDEVIDHVKRNRERCLVICVTTHGSEREDDQRTRQHCLCLYNERITTQSIIDKLADDDDLKLVQKIIMISACRIRPDSDEGEGRDVGVQIQLVDDPKEEYSNITSVPSPPPPPPESVNAEVSSCFIPELPENCALWFASPSGKIAYAKSGGTYFFEEFYNKVKEGSSSSSVDIMDLMLSVHRSMSDLIVKKQFKVIPSFIHNMTSSFQFTKVP